MTTLFERLRRTEYARLDAGGHAYLDFTGAGLYARSQIERHHRRMLADVLGNPHSENAPSREATLRMQRAKRRVLDFLHADPARWDVVFTANATAALRLVGESFPFRPGSRFLLTRDNHNSVNGIRCFATRNGASVAYVPLDAELRACDPAPWLRDANAGTPHLFAFPAQSNFSGVRHPLEWTAQARASGFRVLLDAAAFVPTAPLHLDRDAPDYLCLSFYKMFGHPTGIGALVAQRDALAALRRPWFAGGAVEWVSTQHGSHALRAGAEAFEDGTADFLAFDAVCDGLDLLDAIGMHRIREHVRTLTDRLLHGLRDLRHEDETPRVILHGPADTVARGGTVAFNLRDRAGEVVPFDRVVHAAAQSGVSLRGGCFCNPGAAEAAFAFPDDRTRECLDALDGAFTIPAFAACLGSPVGAVRASVGVPTVASDIDRLVDMLARFPAI